ncbi:MAG: alfa-L-rhamnosidase, partial [Lachnospiraceae bacterium]|nr:alfa-L-rhamnosidase [Lachnospiraceae bacterium]
ICKEGRQTYHPVLTFFGFRYLKLEEFPKEAGPEQFTAVVVCSNLKKTGYLSCSDPDLNQLFSNIFWGQKGNFLDIPTDCPQRDERLGWTGDAQVFVKTASYNYDVEKFFTKWLHDMAADQRKDGGVGHVIPACLPGEESSAAWGDAAVICPWQIYQTYGNKQILEEQFECMKKWVDYITGATTVPYLWTGGEHFGDWLGLDAPSGSYKGSSREEFIATAFYAHSTELLIEAAKVLGKDVGEYERLYENIVKAFRENYPEYLTQTEHILAVHFRLAKDLQKTADDLAGMIKRDGSQIRTGFVGTPYILHVLSEYGHSDLAYTLFLRKEYPSWLFSVKQGATTIWEHWDGIMENGDFWSTDMNSFNHYAYGSVADWVYEKAAGIRPLEEYPGFQKVLIKPMADRRLKWLEASIDTRNGKVASKWICTPEGIRYEIETAVPAVIEIGDKKMEAAPGKYTFWS